MLFNGSTGDGFRTTVGVRQGCFLPPTLFNSFLEKILTDALENHEDTVRFGGKKVKNLRFADDIDGLACKEKLENIVKTLETIATACGMEIRSEKTNKQRPCRIRLIVSQKNVGEMLQP